MQRREKGRGTRGERREEGEKGSGTRGERKKGRRWAICIWKNLRVLAASREKNNQALAAREEAHAKARRREEGGRGARGEG